MKSDNNSTPTVAVIGAGWAGLSAAVTLVQAGIPATVFEASRHLGGRARSVRFNEGSGDDIALDNGQHVLIGAYKETLRIMRVVGAAPGHKLERIPLELRFADGFHMRAPVLPYPLNLGVALFAAYGMTPRLSLAAVKFMRALQAARFRVDPDRTVESLLREHAQPETVCRHLWEPLCVSALNTPPSRASAQVFATVLRDGLTGARHHSDLLIPRVDLGNVFPEPAAHYIATNGGTVHLGTPVKSIERIGQGYRLDHRPETYSQVIVAVAPQHASALLAPLEAACPDLTPERARIDGLEYEPIVTCYTQYAQGVTTFRPMIGMTDGLVQWVFDRGHLLTPSPYRKPDTPLSGLLAAVISASGDHEDLDNEALAGHVHEEVLPLLLAPLGVGKNPLWSRVIREKRATFSCVPSLQRPAGITPLEGLLLAGDYVAGEYPGTLEAAVRSGLAAARKILGA